MRFIQRLVRFYHSQDSDDVIAVLSYNARMRNWSVDTSRFEKNSDEYEIWQLEQLLNFGMSEGETIDRGKLEKYLPLLRIDTDTRDFLEYILYDKKPAHSKPIGVS